ncbi:hypothetical protein [Opitutus sp. GAS368]|jgi:hypothetical protein|uniref:hypothetical protein n=1 Tax=Opitutus sp. GAS368 TaxID=1882749 RepID=UPI00087CF5BF|nr:hypothetical protein [Opitutus sp. GAS368]SDS65774.1 hypothetical protein SAMN05444173_3562 [Opitutus sp. GAS368]
MKSHQQFLPIVLLTGTAGLAVFVLANTELAARFPFEPFLAVLASLALIRFAFSDYARRPKPLPLPATVLRPVPRRTVRASACVGRVAA